MAFDPDAYLKKKAEKSPSGGFDADAYLSKKKDSDPTLTFGRDKDPGQMSADSFRDAPPETPGRALFPSTAAARERGAGLGGQVAGVASDMASGLLRIPAAAGRVIDTRMGWSGNGPQSFTESLAQINRGEDARGDEAFIPKVTRDPATAVAAATLPVTGPILASVRGAGFLGATGRLAGAGALEGVASGAAHSVDDLARTGRINPATIPTEAVIGGVLGPAAGAVGWTLGQGARALRGLGRGAQEVLPAAPLRTSADPTQALREGLEQVAPGVVPPRVTRQGITLTPSQAAGETTGLRPAIEQFAQTNPFLNDIPAEIAERNAQAIPAAVLAQRNQLPNRLAGVGDITPSATGGRIDEAARAAREGMGQRFAQGQDAALRQSGVGSMDLPTHHAPKRDPVTGRMMKNQVQDVIQDIDGYLRDAGYNPAKGFTGQEGGLSRQAINFVQSQKDLIGNAKTTTDLLNQRRRIAREIYDGSVGDAPLFRDRDMAFLEGFERRINDGIERQFDLAVGAGEGQIPYEAARAAKNLWNANNLSYSQNRRILESVDRGLGVSSAKTNVEQYFNRIQNVGVENLQALRRAADKSEELRPMFQELQSGFFDNFLKKSTSKATDGALTISPEKLATEWRKMDNGLKRTMVPQGVIEEMDELVEVVAQSRTNQASLTNPSGTARLLNLTQAVRNPSEWVQGLLLRGPIREYYRTGNIMPAESILNVLHRTGRVTEGSGRAIGAGVRAGSKAVANPVSRQAIRSELAGAYDRPSLYELTSRNPPSDSLLSQVMRSR